MDSTTIWLALVGLGVVLVIAIARGARRRGNPSRRDGDGGSAWIAGSESGGVRKSPADEGKDGSTDSGASGGWGSDGGGGDGGGGGGGD